MLYDFEAVRAPILAEWERLERSPDRRFLEAALAHAEGLCRARNTVLPGGFPMALADALGVPPA